MYSTGSCIASLSAEASVQLYEERLKPRIDTIKNSDATLHEIVDASEKLVNEVFAPNPQSTFTHYSQGERVTSVQLDKVMLSMLEFAEECGGERAKRYVAAAISSCAQDADVVGALAALGVTWLTHLLFVFKTSSGHANQPNKTPSEAATPTATHLTEGVGHGKEVFTPDVLRRDGYVCLITGMQDVAHPNPSRGVQTARLVAAPILCRALRPGLCDTNPHSDSYKSALTTFDILLDFTRLPARTLEELSAELDRPSNGITLSKDSRDGFDSFEWCLKKTEIDNVYDVKILKDRYCITRSRITLRDHSEDFSDSGLNLKTTKASVDLPNACYFEIHAAIAGILHTSGAGTFFDELLDENNYYGNEDYEDDEDMPKLTVRCWSDLERVIQERLLWDSVVEAFQLQASVC